MMRPLHLAFQLKRRISSGFPCRRKQQSSSIRISGLETTYHKYLRGVKQGIFHSQNMIHALFLWNFYNSIKSLVKALKVNRNILASCRESESSIIANLLRVLKKSTSSEFNSYIGHFQEKYDNGTNIDLYNFMRKIVIKYDSLVKDGQWDTKSEKDVDILALTGQIQELKILFAKQSTYQDRNNKLNFVNTWFNYSCISWKTTVPKSGKSWTKEKNGRTFHW